MSKAAVDEGQPQAYLNYLVFDKNMVLIEEKSGYEALTTAAREDGSNRPHEELATEIIVTEPGYVYIYPEASSGQVLSTDGSVPKDVYFDQFNVEHAHSAIVQSDDYYLFGLSFNSYRGRTAWGIITFITGRRCRTTLIWGGWTMGQGCMINRSAGGMW